MTPQDRAAGAAPAPGPTTSAPDSAAHDATSKSRWRIVWDWIKSFIAFFVAIVISLGKTLQAFLFLVIKTPYILVPSAAHTSSKDDDYNDQLVKELADAVSTLTLDADPIKSANKQKFVRQNWIDQIAWTNNRATRERDANELIRWWQIILGVLIPVLVNLSVGWKDTAVSVAGIFVAILTAIYQFRRPEERWRHYRVVNERYLTELWSYIMLAGDYKGQTHAEAFSDFNTAMMKIRQEETTKFFGEVVPPSQAPQPGAPGTGTPGKSTPFVPGTSDAE